MNERIVREVSLMINVRDLSPAQCNGPIIRHDDLVEHSRRD